MITLNLKLIASLYIREICLMKSADIAFRSHDFVFVCWNKTSQISQLFPDYCICSIMFQVCQELRFRYMFSKGFWLPEFVK